MFAPISPELTYDYTQEHQRGIRENAHPKTQINSILPTRMLPEGTDYKRIGRNLLSARTAMTIATIANQPMDTVPMYDSHMRRNDYERESHEPQRTTDKLDPHATYGVADNGDTFTWQGMQKSIT